MHCDPELSIVIVNYNAKKYLEQCLSFIYENTKKINFEIILIDNCSSDNSSEMVKREFPEVKLIQNAINKGFAKANNQAIIKSKGKYILLLNPDTIFLSNILEELISFLERNKKVGIVAPRLLNKDLTIQGSARAFPDITTAFFGRTSFLTKLFPKSKYVKKNILFKDELFMKDAKEVDWLSGAYMLIRSKAIKEVGLLDENYFMYFEDVDLCKRMWNNGWKVVYYPKAEIIHYVGGSTKNQKIALIIELHKSAYIFYKKYNKKMSNIFYKSIVIFGLFMRILLRLSIYYISILSSKVSQ